MPLCLNEITFAACDKGINGKSKKEKERKKKPKTKNAKEMKINNKSGFSICEMKRKDE